MQMIRIAEHSIVLSVSYDKTADCVAGIRRLYHSLQQNPPEGVVSIRPGLDALLLEYDSNESLAQSINLLERMQHRETPGFPTATAVLQVPVCYDLGYDLESISAQTGLSREEVVALHTSQEYQVWMIGFMPGFPYMGELPAGLQIARKSAPDLLVPGGAVAIADEYVGIYPFDSPGGWHVIGRTPIKILDYEREIPCTFQYGMKVRFMPVSYDEFERIQRT